MSARKATLLAFTLALIPGYLLAQGTARPGLVKSAGVSSSTILPGTGTTNTLTSSTTDATTTSSIAAFTMKLLNDIAGADLHTAWRDSADTAVMKLTEGGALTTSDRVTSFNGFSGDAYVQLTDNGTAGILYQATTATNPTEAGHRFDSTRTLTTNIASFLNNTTAKARVAADGFYVQPAQTVTVANDGTGAAPASAITPTSNIVLLAYNDVTAGSVGTISETGAVEGKLLTIVHTGSGSTVTFTEVAGQQEIGASACTIGLSDTIQAVYANSSWHFMSCRDN